MSVSHVAKDAIMAMPPRRWRILLTFLCGVGLVSGGWAWWADRRYQSAMEEIESEIMAGRYAIACRHLDKLLSWRADPQGGIVYLLGSCELARGRNQAAGEAWARVAPGSAFSERAIRGRLRLFHDSGQFAAAERSITDSASDPRNDRTALLVLLVPMFSESGRIDEAERLIEDRWEQLNALGEGALEPAIKLVRLHIELTLKPTPVETIRTALDRASRLVPDDDRVWLGRANLAIRTGAFDEAKHWLDACHERRPEDVPTRTARLSWAIATNRKDEQPVRAGELLARKPKSTGCAHRYVELYDRKQPIRDAVESARLAEQLGRRFEARVFLTIAIAEKRARDDDLRHDLERLSRGPRTAADRHP